METTTDFEALNAGYQDGLQDEVKITGSKEMDRRAQERGYEAQGSRYSYCTGYDIGASWPFKLSTIQREIITEINRRYTSGDFTCDEYLLSAGFSQEDINTAFGGVRILRMDSHGVVRQCPSQDIVDWIATL